MVMVHIVLDPAHAVVASPACAISPQGRVSPQNLTEHFSYRMPTAGPSSWGSLSTGRCGEFMRKGAAKGQ